MRVDKYRSISRDNGNWRSGSGKSFGVINPAIRQMIAKGFCLMIYDFKFPDRVRLPITIICLRRVKILIIIIASTLLTLMRLKNQKGKPFQKEYVKLWQRRRKWQKLWYLLYKGQYQLRRRIDQFFTQSAINFLSSCIYFCYPREWKIFGSTSYTFFYEQKL